MKTQMKISKRAQAALDNTASSSLALRAVILFAAQNPGFEWGNYYTPGDIKQSLESYRSDSRPVTRDWQRICGLLWQTRYVTDADVEQAARAVYGGRLSVGWHGGELQSHGCGFGGSRVFGSGEWAVEYITGQYFPTEYRRAAYLTIEQAIEIARSRVAGVV